MKLWISKKEPRIVWGRIRWPKPHAQQQFRSEEVPLRSRYTFLLPGNTAIQHHQTLINTDFTAFLRLSQTTNCLWNYIFNFKATESISFVFTSLAQTTIHHINIQCADISFHIWWILGRQHINHQVAATKLPSLITSLIAWNMKGGKRRAKFCIKIHFLLSQAIKKSANTHSMKRQQNQ